MKTSSDEIDKTLSSLDDLARANDNPFLFAKIQYRMQANANARSYPKSLANVGVSLAMILLVLNMLTLWNNLNTKAVQSGSDLGTELGINSGIISIYE
jgi:hypothetical protein